MDIRFPAFSLAPRTQVMSSHTCAPNMVQSVSSIKRDETCLELSEEWPPKAVLDRNKINKEELLILRFLVTQLFQPSSLVIYDSDFQRILVE